MGVRSRSRPSAAAVADLGLRRPAGDPQQIRQNLRQEIESLTSAHKLSYPSLYRNLRNISRR